MRSDTAAVDWSPFYLAAASLPNHRYGSQERMVTGKVATMDRINASLAPPWTLKTLSEHWPREFIV